MKTIVRLLSALLIAFGACTLNAAPAGVKLTQGAATVTQFDFAEFTLAVEKPDAANPFTDVTVRGEVTPEGDAPVKGDGFCDAADGSVFRVRFLPVKAGPHAIAITYRQGAFECTERATLTAVPGPLAGPVRVDAEHPFPFVREGTGQHWFCNSTTTTNCSCGTMHRSLNPSNGSQSSNRIRVALAGRTPDGKRWNEPLV